MNRREFFKSVGISALGCLGLGLLKPEKATSNIVATNHIGKIQTWPLEIDGSRVRFVTKVRGKLLVYTEKALFEAHYLEGNRLAVWKIRGDGMVA